uniref:Uncharacterized protein n=1 Tax=Vibrio tasmaniensis TaxID=212663 RepID=A0A0H3ZP59_9VIBR|nr:hypothetical protein [Vibrio tasmaniensis]
MSSLWGVTLFIDFPLMNLINDRAYVRLWCTITKYLIMTKIESVHFLTRVGAKYMKVRPIEFNKPNPAEVSTM